MKEIRRKFAYYRFVILNDKVDFRNKTKIMTYSFLFKENVECGNLPFIDLSF